MGLVGMAGEGDRLPWGTVEEAMRLERRGKAPGDTNRTMMGEGREATEKGESDKSQGA